MRLTRRFVLSGLVLGMTPGAVAQEAGEQSGTPDAEDNRPNCLDLKLDGSWRLLTRGKADGTVDAYLASRGEVVSMLDAGFGAPGYSFATMRHRSLHLRRIAHEKAVHVDYRFPAAGSDAEDWKWEDAGFGETTLRILFDGKPQATVGGQANGTSRFKVDGPFLPALLAARTMTLYAQGDGRDVVGERFDVAGLGQHFEKLEDQRRTHALNIEAAGGCKAGDCIMTSAAVGLLGRPDHCFELTQMRRLRARFPDKVDVVNDYLGTGARLLAQPTGPLFKAALVAFYAAIVWPTALLARAGLMHAAGYYYLAGFTALKASFARRLQCGPPIR